MTAEIQAGHGDCGASGEGSGGGRDPIGAVLVVRRGGRARRRGIRTRWGRRGEANRGGPDEEDRLEKTRRGGSGAQESRVWNSLLFHTLGTQWTYYNKILNYINIKF